MVEGGARRSGICSGLRALAESIDDGLTRFRPDDAVNLDGRAGLELAHRAFRIRTVFAVDGPGIVSQALKGDRKGTYAVSVSGNWRVTFQFVAGDAVFVNLEDYH